MCEILLYGLWVFDCGNDFHFATTLVAGFDIDVEDPLEESGPTDAGF